MLELVGLENGENGRTCGLHARCGDQVGPGTILKLNFNDITINESIQVERVISTYAPPTKKARGSPKKLPMETVTEIQSRTERVLEARIWNNSVSSCLVGYIGKAFIAVYGNMLEGRIVKVRDLDSLSDYETVRQRSKENSGLALVIVIG